MIVDHLYQPSDLLRFVDLGGGALVPRSSAVVYVANTLDGKTVSKDTALWLADGGEYRRLAPGNGAQSRPAVSPDGRRVAFLQVQAEADGKEAAQLCVCPLDGGETTVLTSFPRGTGRSARPGRRTVSTSRSTAATCPGAIPSLRTALPGRSGAWMAWGLSTTS